MLATNNRMGNNRRGPFRPTGERRSTNRKVLPTPIVASHSLLRATRGWKEGLVAA